MCLYIKRDFFSCFENLTKIYKVNSIKERKNDKILKKHKKKIFIILSFICFLKICLKISFFYIETSPSIFFTICGTTCYSFKWSEMIF